MHRRASIQAPGARRRGLLLALLAAGALLFPGTSLAGDATAAPGTGPSAPAATASPASAFPLRIVDDEGTALELDAAPQRIVSLSPANTEIVFALGAGDRLVGGSAFDDHPAEAAALPDAATFEGVVMEQLVDLAPDLVLAGGNGLTPADDIARMRELGFDVLVVYAPDVPAVLADIELIGQAIGEADAANALTETIATQLDAVAEAAAATGSRPRTYYELDYFEGVTYGPAPDSFVADMVSLAGGDPVTTGDPVAFEMPLERLVEADPQVIVLGDANYGVCPPDVEARPGWGDMRAVVDGAVRPVDDVPVTRPGPRLAHGLASLARAIHPELELADFPPDGPLCSAG
jgi:iron complex transport system substrate-binding protein